MSFVVRGFGRFWSGSGKQLPSKSPYPYPWPAPRLSRFRPTPPTTLSEKIKSYIPSRKWLIFGGIIATWMSVAAYDRREKKKTVARWCKKVEHLSRRPIAFDEDIPSVGVWIGVPPGDQLKWNKEVWRDYVKPIIVAAGYDYSLHLNAKQGLTRTSMREIIVGHRRQRESSTDVDGAQTPREKEGGDIIVVGRNTFKEIVRGVHEGYLLPLDYIPPAPVLEEPKDEGEKKDKDSMPPKDPVLSPISLSQYLSLPDPSDSRPEYTFTYIPSLHILGFRHTPRRIYRFLTKRYVADEICSQVVACILEQERREWSDDDAEHGRDEERFWPKSVKPDAEWRDGMLVDPRIRPKLFWRRPSEVQEIPDYREPLAPENQEVNLRELQPTEEELARDQELRAQAATASDSRPVFTARTPWNR